MLPAITSPAFTPLRPITVQVGRLGPSALSEADAAKIAEQARAADTLRTSARTARDEARGQVKARAKETVQRLQEEFKLIRKLWAGQPKEMARQLARLAKELKHALKDYAAAAKDNGERAEAARAVLEQPASSEASGAPKDAESAKAVAAYEKTTRDTATEELGSAEDEARGDKDFIHEVRGFLKKLREEFQAAKVKSAAARPDRDRAKAFEGAAKEMSEVDEALTDMAKDLDKAFPNLDASPLTRTASA